MSHHSEDNPRFWGLKPKLRAKIENAEQAAKSQDMVPACPQGHGSMELHNSKKDHLYWRCSYPKCREKEWHKELTQNLCPRCARLMEKVPSKKVKGGSFLLCQNRSAHTDDVVLFRNKDTGDWEAPLSVIDTEVRAARTPVKVKERPAPEKLFVDKDTVRTVLVLLSAVEWLASAGVKQEALLYWLRGEAVELAAALGQEEEVISQLPNALKLKGKLAHLSLDELNGWVDRLIDEDLLRFIPREGTLKATDRGLRYLSGRTN